MKNIDITEAVRLGKRKDDGNPRPLLVSLGDPGKKSVIFKITNWLIVNVKVNRSDQSPHRTEQEALRRGKLSK